MRRTWWSFEIPFNLGPSKWCYDAWFNKMQKSVVILQCCVCSNSNKRTIYWSDTTVFALHSNREIIHDSFVLALEFKNNGYICANLWVFFSLSLSYHSAISILYLPKYYHWLFFFNLENALLLSPASERFFFFFFFLPYLFLLLPLHMQVLHFFFSSEQSYWK